jgi:hypothetical protein
MELGNTCICIYTKWMHIFTYIYTHIYVYIHPIYIFTHIYFGSMLKMWVPNFQLRVLSILTLPNSSNEKPGPIILNGFIHLFNTRTHRREFHNWYLVYIFGPVLENYTNSIAPFSFYVFLLKTVKIHPWFFYILATCLFLLFKY